MTIANNNVANGILTGTGVNLVSTNTNNSSVTMIYNVTLARWIVTSNSGMVSSNDWHITGNAATNDPAVPVTYGTSTIAAGENWSGTTDANDYVLGTNNIERLRVKQTTGFVGIGTAAPIYRFDARTTTAGAYTAVAQNNFVGTADGAGFYGFANNAPGYGYGGYFEGAYMGVRSSVLTSAYTGGAFGVLAECQGTSITGTRYGGYFSASGTNAFNYAGYFSALGGTNNHGLVVANGNVGIGNTNPTRALLQTQGAIGNTVATFNLGLNSQGIALVSDQPGVFFNSYFNGGYRQMSSTGYPSIFNFNPAAGQFEFTMSNTANTVAGNLSAGSFYNRLVITRNAGATFDYWNNSAATALGAYSGNIYPNLAFFSIGATIASPNAGKGIETGGENIGIEARANTTNMATVDKMPGLFYVSNTSGPFLLPAVAAVGSVVDNVGYKIIGFGLVSTLVRDTNEKDRVMVAPEAPEALFQDYGAGTLVNGHAKIEIDPILSKNIRVDSTHPLKVFIQLEGDCNGVYVYNKTQTSFEVKELQNGNSNVAFTYQIVGVRADEERGGHVSKFSEMRFKPLTKEFRAIETTKGGEVDNSKNMTTHTPEIIPLPEVREMKSLQTPEGQK